MNHTQRLSMTAVVVASALAAFGCASGTGQDAFSQVNNAFIAAKSGTAKLQNVQLPAAAIATTLGAVEMIQTLSKISGGQTPGGGAQIIAAGGGNVVAAGGGNLASKAAGFAPMFHLTADDGTVHDEDVTNPVDQVKMHVTYTSSQGADGSTMSAISSFTGVSQGYNITAKGSFSYTPAADANSPAKVHADMSGSATYGDINMSINTLGMNTTFPLPQDGTIGALDFSQKDGSKVLASIKADVSVKGGKIAASGSITQGTTTQAVSCDQDHPTCVDSTSTAAAGAH